MFCCLLKWWHMHHRVLVFSLIHIIKSMKSCDRILCHLHQEHLCITLVVCRLKAYHLKLFNPRPTKPFFVTWFTKGGGYHPLMNLKLTGPKYVCLVPWYRVGSPLSIDTKIMKIGQRMTSQRRFQTWPVS